MSGVLKLAFLTVMPNFLCLFTFRNAAFRLLRLWLAFYRFSAVFQNSPYCSQLFCQGAFPRLDSYEVCLFLLYCLGFDMNSQPAQGSYLWHSVVFKEADEWHFYFLFHSKLYFHPCVLFLWFLWYGPLPKLSMSLSGFLLFISLSYELEQPTMTCFGKFSLLSVFSTSFALFCFKLCLYFFCILKLAKLHSVFLSRVALLSFSKADCFLDCWFWLRLLRLSCASWWTWEVHPLMDVFLDLFEDIIE